MRLWVLSWAARGWQPRVLLSDEDYDGLFVTPDTINFSHKSTRKRQYSLHMATFGRDGWDTHSLVRFPDAQTDDDILACGRPLDL